MTSSPMREVHADHRRDEQKLRYPVTVADRVDRVIQGSGEAKIACHRHRVQAKARTGKSAGSERRLCGPHIPIPEPVKVSTQGVDVFGEFMTERDRLRVLQVGEAR